MVDLPEGRAPSNAFETTIAMTLTMTIIMTKIMMMKWIDMKSGRRIIVDYHDDDPNNYDDHDYGYDLNHDNDHDHDQDYDHRQ